MINILKTADVKFKISDWEYIKINNKSIENDVCEQCVLTDIDYVDELKNIKIRFGSNDVESIYNVIGNSSQFKRLMRGENILDVSTIADLGFTYNECYNKGISFESFFDYYFEGNAHNPTPPYFDSWLYNDKDGNIIFEITPFYPWHGKTKKTNPEKVSYKEWIKDYKPTLKTMIPKENLKQWIEQAKELKKTLLHEHTGS